MKSFRRKLEALDVLCRVDICVCPYVCRESYTANGSIPATDWISKFNSCHSALQLNILCLWQVGKKFQQPAGATPKQYERAQYMLDRLGLSVRVCHLCLAK